jgi:ParB-like chromosome segregation protein Spo0J
VLSADEEYFSYTDVPAEWIPIESLGASLSPRAHGVDHAYARMIAETEGELDPIVVHRDSMSVIDGMHRIRVAELRGEQKIAARFFDGSAEDAFVVAVRLNVWHGRTLTLNERRAAALRIISTHAHWSDRAIAEQVGLSAKTVGKLRQGLGTDHIRPAVRIGQDGRSRPDSTVEGRQRAASILNANPHMPLRELSRQSGLSVGTARNVRERLRLDQDPVPERLRVHSAPAEARTDLRYETGNPLQAETGALVRKLAQDPSLRYTDDGRTLLRVLLATEMERSRWEEIIRMIPAHCAAPVRAIMLKRSADWRYLAGLALVGEEPEG